MMQEVSCDDNNGESTFEFVERKMEDLNVMDDAMPTILSPPTAPTSGSGDAQPTAPPSAEAFVPTPSLPAPMALPQFDNFPTDYTAATTTTTRSVPTPLVSTIPPSPTPIPPTTPYRQPAPFASPGIQMPQPGKSENVRANPYSLAAQRKRPSYPMVNPNVDVIAPPVMEGYQGVVQAQPTAFYGAVPQASAPAPSTAINFGSYDMGMQQQQQMMMPSYSSQDADSGILHWVREMSRHKLISKFAETAKSSVDSMITTLDPQMKEYIHSGGDVNLYVASNDEESVSAIREAFQTVFGRATIRGITSQNPLAPQLVGFSAGMKAGDERIQHLRKTLVVDEQQPLVAVDHFIAELTPDKWFDLACLVLHDPLRAVHLHVYSQPTPVPNEVVQRMQEETPSDFTMRWSGLCVTVGNILSRMYQMQTVDWHEMMSGVAKRQIILLAAKTLATQYKLGMLNKS